jgi:hypothetical protein
LAYNIYGEGNMAKTGTVLIVSIAIAISLLFGSTQMAVGAADARSFPLGSIGSVEQLPAVSALSPQAGTCGLPWCTFLPIAIKDGPVIFSDDFSSAKDWGLPFSCGGSAGINNGQYYLTSSTKSQTCIALAPAAAENIPAAGYIVRVQANRILGDDLSYGIVFDWISTTQFSFAYLKPQNQGYAVYNYNSGVYTLLANNTNPAINTNSTNQLEVVRTASAITLTVNGTLLPSISQLKTANGQVGIVMLVYNNIPAETHYDNFFLSRLN